MTSRSVALLILVTLAPLAADAQSYRCIARDGKRYYGSIVPAECFGRPVEQLNAQGLVVKRIDPEALEKERLLKEATEARKAAEEAAGREVARRNRALLATYTSEKDIDDARARALAENAKVVHDIENRLESIRKRQSGYEKEIEAYKGKGEAPAKLREDLQVVENELKTNEQLLEAKKREVGTINARYDDDKKRYSAITTKR
jgi:DNA repair exonuclease SbcCD ATPase subunit